MQSSPSTIVTTWSTSGSGAMNHDDQMFPIDRNVIPMMNSS